MKYSSMFIRLSFLLNTLPDDLDFGQGYLPTKISLLWETVYVLVFSLSNLYSEIGLYNLSQ